MSASLLIPEGPPPGWRLGIARWWEAMTEGLQRGTTLTIGDESYEAPQPYRPDWRQAMYAAGLNARPHWYESTLQDRELVPSG